MNARRRKELTKISDKLMEIQAELQFINEAEQEAYDNTPESLQETDRYAESEEAISAMEDADGAIQEAIDYLSDWIG